ncbi:hypothetical protein [Streptomyces sp. URMC 123]|uniref:hypothetical protein n=1 Tax=Streptomyces sp. URMC 123 TaxID=3423403 RepID=UPI003F1CB411
MTCADTTMLMTFLHEAGAQYVAAVMFALTTLVIGALRSGRRRASHRRERRASLPGNATAAKATPGPDHAVAPTSQEPTASSAGRREESS